MTVKVLDVDLDPNTVIDYDDPFYIDWEITLEGSLPTFLFGKFQVEAFAESVGPGPEISLGTQWVTAKGDHTYSGRLTVAAHTLDHAGQGTPPASGIYEVAVTAFYTNPDESRTVISGYRMGTVIKIRQP